MKSRSLVDFSIGVNKFHVTVRYEDFQKLKNDDFSRRFSTARCVNVASSNSDFLISDRVSGPLGGPAITRLSRFKLRYRYCIVLYCRAGHSPPGSEPPNYSKLSFSFSPPSLF